MSQAHALARAHSVFDDHARLVLENICKEKGWSFSQAKEAILEELHLRRYRKILRAEKEQLAAFRHGGERRVAKVGGEEIFVAHQIHTAAHHEWGQKLGYDCWQCPTFVREFLRDNPQCRVKTIRDAHITSGIAFETPPPAAIPSEPAGAAVSPAL